MKQIIDLGYENIDEVAQRTLVLRFREDACKVENEEFRNTVLAQVSTEREFVERMEEYEHGLLFILKSKELNYMVDVFKARENVLIENYAEETAFNIFILQQNRRRSRGKNSQFLRSK